MSFLRMWRFICLRIHAILEPHPPSHQNIVLLFVYYVVLSVSQFSSFDSNALISGVCSMAGCHNFQQCQLNCFALRIITSYYVVYSLHCFSITSTLTTSLPQSSKSVRRLRRYGRRRVGPQRSVKILFPATTYGAHELSRFPLRFNQHVWYSDMCYARWLFWETTRERWYSRHIDRRFAEQHCRFRRLTSWIKAEHFVMAGRHTIKRMISWLGCYRDLWHGRFNSRLPLSFAVEPQGGIDVSTCRISPGLRPKLVWRNKRGVFLLSHSWQIIQISLLMSPRSTLRVEGFRNDLHEKRSTTFLEFSWKQVSKMHFGDLCLPIYLDKAYKVVVLSHMIVPTPSATISRYQEARVGIWQRVSYVSLGLDKSHRLNSTSYFQSWQAVVIEPTFVVAIWTQIISSSHNVTLKPQHSQQNFIIKMRCDNLNCRGDHLHPLCSANVQLAKNFSDLCVWHIVLTWRA